MERRVAKLERRSDNMEAAILQLIEAAQTHSEMMDDFFRGMIDLRAAQANTDVKIAALVDAQIRAEDLFHARAAEQGKRNTEQEKRSAEQDVKITALVDAQIRAEDLAQARAAEQEKRFVEQEKRAAEQEKHAAEQEKRSAEHETRMAQHEAQMAELRRLSANLALIVQTIKARPE